MIDGGFFVDVEALRPPVSPLNARKPGDRRDGALKLGARSDVSAWHKQHIFEVLEHWWPR